MYLELCICRITSGSSKILVINSVSVCNDFNCVTTFALFVKKAGNKEKNISNTKQSVLFCLLDFYEIKTTSGKVSSYIKAKVLKLDKQFRLIQKWIKQCEI